MSTAPSFKLDLELYRRKPKETVPVTFDASLQSLGIRMTREEKKVKHGLYDMILDQNTKNENIRDFPFMTLNVHEIENDLYCMVPKKVTAYVHNPASQPKPKRSRSSAKDNKDTTNAFGGTKSKAVRAQEAVQSQYYVKDEYLTKDYGPDRKRGRASSEDELGLAESMLSTKAPVLPKNFYALANELFTGFWEMDIEDELAPAFFAVISNTNCASYGLPKYSEIPMSLAVIRNRLDATRDLSTSFGGSSRTRQTEPVSAYRGIEDFYSDFKQMFENILTYYPTDSPVRAKAIELSAKFQELWVEVKNKFN